MMSIDEFVDKVNHTIHEAAIQNSSGFLQRMVRYQLGIPGKQFRVRLVYEITRALELEVRHLVPWAACCELIHLASIIQDDIQDRDELRRNKASVWHEFGVEQAINLDVYFLAMAKFIVLQSRADELVKCRLAQIANQAVMSLVQGQSEEMSALKMDLGQVTLASYFKWVELKTATLFLATAQGPMQFQSRPVIAAGELYSCMNALGVGFQLADDILDLYADKGRKELGCDIKEGKLSFLVLEHLRHHPSDANAIDSKLKKPRQLTTLEDIEFCRDLFSSKGTPVACAGKAFELVQCAMLEHAGNLPQALRECLAKCQRMILAPLESLHGHANTYRSSI